MKGLTLTEGTLTALLCMQKYRFLSIRQFARLTGNRYDHAAETLREMEKRRILGYLAIRVFPGMEEHQKSISLQNAVLNGWSMKVICQERRLARSMMSTVNLPGQRRCITACGSWTVSSL